MFSDTCCCREHVGALSQSWKLFTPLLHKIAEEKPKPYIYKRGTRGPLAADELVCTH